VEDWGGMWWLRRCWGGDVLSCGGACEVDAGRELRARELC